MGTIRNWLWTLMAVIVWPSGFARAVPTAQLTDPASGRRVFDTISISGVALFTPAPSANYTLAYGAGDAPVSWTNFCSGATPTSAAGGLLCRWFTEETRANGIYTIRLTVTDSDGTTASDTIRLNIQNPLVPRDSFRVTAPAEWRPGDFAVIQFDLAAPGLIQVRIDAPNPGACRRMLYPEGARCGGGPLTHEFPAGSHVLYWDGRDDNGAFLGDAGYAYLCVMAGTDRPLSSDRPRVTGLQVSAPLFDPSEAETTTISYNLSAAADVTLQVIDFENPPKVVRNLIVAQRQIAGTYQAAWDGKNDRGLLLAPGPYQFRIQATNETGPSLPVFGPVQIRF